MRSTVLLATSDIKKADITVKVQSFFLKVIVKGEVIIDDRFLHSVVPDECNWQIDADVIDPTSKRLWMTFLKKEPTTKNEFWTKILSKDVIEEDDDIFGPDLAKKVYHINPDDPNSIQAALSKVQKKDQ